LGTAFWAERKHREAVELLGKALQSYQQVLGANHPSTIEATNQLSWYLATAPESSGAGNPAKAVELSKRAVAASPKERKYWNTLSAVQYNAGNWTEAVGAAEKVLEIGKEQGLDDSDPWTRAATYNLSIDLALAPERSGVPDAARALALSKKLVAAAPGEGSYRLTLGMAQYRCGNWTETVKSLEKYVELTKDQDSTVWFFLAMAHWRQGHREQARRRYRMAVNGMGTADGPRHVIVDLRTEAEALIVDPTALPECVFAP
jgi:tetratricopeptide (TPR) repeat protein